MIVTSGKREYILSAFLAIDSPFMGLELPSASDNFPKARHIVYLSFCLSAVLADFCKQSIASSKLPLSI